MCNCMCTEEFLFCIVKNWKDIQRVLLRKKSAEKKPKSKIDPKPFEFLSNGIFRVSNSTLLKYLENQIFIKSSNSDATKIDQTMTAICH